MSEPAATAATAAAESSPKPKILCLHGFAESAEIFKIRSRNIRGLVGDHAEMVYLDGPLDVGNLRFTAEDFVKPKQNPFTNLAWWWWKTTGQRSELRGLGDTLEKLANVLNEQGPFDGILGFSQGAALAILLAEMLQEGSSHEYLKFPKPVEHPQFKFVILAGAFGVEPEEYQGIYDTKLNVPSLHMTGEYDTVIETKRSRKMMEVFVDPVVFEFRGGHFIPQTPECLRVVRSFLLPFIPDLEAEQ
ncbi:Ovarian cancer-associated protein 2 [Coemansia interrupta]|uniref:Ovarian cancer-associated protein 2 n=1 Tax=Coemansia interrupta TaxID=1126814 RepID=A0A9W8H5P4_9FUNG|nr:Ovarian cancer-associated protein 2 [Coemansia interrupta]